MVMFHSYVNVYQNPGCMEVSFQNVLSHFYLTGYNMV